MGQLRIEWKGIPEAIDALRAWGEREQAATIVAVGDAGSHYKRMAIGAFQGAHAPGFPHEGGDRPNRASGHLQASIKPSPIAMTGRGRYEILVGPTTVYGRIIELGGHITPQHASVLSWFSPWLGKRMYKDSVTLGGWPYMLPSLQAFIPRMTSFFEVQWEGAVNA
jgi:hypothetical protein